MMRFLYTFMTGCCLLTLPAFAGEPQFPVNSIADSLKTDAHIVKRLEETTFSVTGLKETRLVHRYVLTVLDESGAENAVAVAAYSKTEDIRYIKGTLYDADGNQIRKLKQSEVKDFSGVDDASLMTDTRYKMHRFYHNVYPYTVEYEIETRMNTTAFFPRWMPQRSSDWSVEQSRFTVIVPAGYRLRYHSYGYKGEPVIKEENGSVSHTWELRQLPASKSEDYDVEWYRLTPAVFIGPSDFEWEQYKGNMNTWQSFGQFVHELNKDRDQLPDKIKATVHALTDALPARQDKIAALYKYLQQHYRYISIQFGIGGWQTFDAAYVADKGYGDCKALTNFMKAMLKEAGIPSCYTLVHAGAGETTLITDFPYSQFNHVILCVPGSDSTWLECTSQTLPAGYLSGFTSGRPVLVINENGGKITRTPDYGLEDNLQLRTVRAAVDAEGNIDIASRTRFTGMQQDNLHARLHALSREELLRNLKKGLDFSSYDITGYNCKENGGRMPAIEEELQIKGTSYATVTGKRMFIQPNLLNRTSSRQTEKSRKSPINLVFPYRDVDTVYITLPEGYKAEALPAPVVLGSSFGKYTSKTILEGNTLTYIRSMERKAGEFPATDFPAFVQFFNAVYKADRNRIVLVKE